MGSVRACVVPAARVAPLKPAYTLHPKQGAIVAVEAPSRKIYGLQYHPEVVHSERGKETLRRFLFDIAKLNGDWKMENVMQEEMDKIRAQVRALGFGFCPAKMGNVMQEEMDKGDGQGPRADACRRVWVLTGDWKMGNVMQEGCGKAGSADGGKARWHT